MYQTMGIKATVSVLVFCVIFLLVSVVANRDSNSRPQHRSKRYIEWGPDIAGPYCETRPGGCCPGRIDDCSVPILDTLCYCDEFCNRTRGDCCPDFFSFCLGIRPSTPSPVRGACEYDGIPYAPYSTVTQNCNKCRCIESSRTATGYAWSCDNNVCLIRQSLINSVNDNPYYPGWIAGNYSKFWGMTLDEGIRKRLGTHKPESIVLDMNPIKVYLHGRLPASFDSRTKWPGWVHGVRDQGNCASSWAFSTTALAADRLTIESRGEAESDLSPQNLMACNSHGQDGCNGGNLDRAWWYLRKRGVTIEDCYPYTAGIDGMVGRCAISRDASSGRCPSGINYRIEDVFHATPPYRIAANETDIMAEIEMNGPVQATFKVRDDFFMYRSGIYRYSGVDNIRPELPEKYQYHSVRIVGWGQERVGREMTKYWLCANSWGTDWGENGYFRIERGNNECEIESFVLGVWGKVEGDEELRLLLSRYRADRLRESRRRNRRHTRKLNHRRKRNKRHH